jgi:hypothetical protein
MTTTLVLPQSRSNGAAGPSSIPCLREWLGERWGIIFSHPGDFDQEQLERDRWLSILARSFREHEVLPIALARREDDAQAASLGWLAELGDGSAAVLWPAAPAPAAGALLDFRVSALRAQIARGGDRFAMIIDSELRCRRMTRYLVAVDLPSPIELVGWAVALRDRQRPATPTERSACGTRRDSPCSPRAQRPRELPAAPEERGRMEA